MTKTREAEIVTVPQPKEVASVESFITKAIEANVSIETLERLLVMRDKVKAEQSKEAFGGSMAKFQAECPVIQKKKIVKDKFGKERYRYAPLDSIVLQVKKPLANNGLSYDFDEIKDEKFVSAICTITHVLGHSKQSTFRVEIGNEEYMTDTQKYGARMTFAKRYAFCNALGILTGDEDVDANGTKEIKSPEVSDEDLILHTEKLESAHDLKELGTFWANLPVHVKKVLEKKKEELKTKLTKSDNA